jgi:hypothetical protein
MGIIVPHFTPFQKSAAVTKAAGPSKRASEGTPIQLMPMVKEQELSTVDRVSVLPTCLHLDALRCRVVTGHQPNTWVSEGGANTVEIRPRRLGADFGCSRRRPCWASVKSNQRCRRQRQRTRNHCSGNNGDDCLWHMGPCLVCSPYFVGNFKQIKRPYLRGLCRASQTGKLALSPGTWQKCPPPKAFSN